MTTPALTRADAAHWARAFHETYERLAPEVDWSRHRPAVPWERVPPQNRALMTAVLAELLPGLVAWAREGMPPQKHRHIAMSTDEAGVCLRCGEIGWLPPEEKR